MSFVLEILQEILMACKLLITFYQSSLFLKLGFEDFYRFALKYGLNS